MYKNYLHFCSLIWVKRQVSEVLQKGIFCNLAVLAKFFLKLIYSYGTGTMSFYVFAMSTTWWCNSKESWGGILCWHQGAAALLNHVLLILVLSDQCTFRSQIYHLLSNEFMFHGFPTQKPLKILATSTMNILQWMAG